MRQLGMPYTGLASTKVGLVSSRISCASPVAAEARKSLSRLKSR